MTTALDLIESSMRLATILASGEHPDADEAIDGLKSLNDILEGWSLENLSVWQTDNLQFALTPGVASYTIGPGGDINATRPVRIGDSYSRVEGTDFPMSVWGYDEYNQVAVKNIGGIPERVAYINDFPLGQLFFYPVPAAPGSTLFLNVDRVLSFPLTLQTVLSFPPGYEKALRYTLAVNLAPEYGVSSIPIVQNIATSAKADLQRANKRRVLASYDPTLQGQPAFAYWQRGY